MARNIVRFDAYLSDNKRQTGFDAEHPIIMAIGDSQKIRMSAKEAEFLRDALDSVLDELKEK